VSPHPLGTRRGLSPHPLGLRRVKDEDDLASSSLSLPPETNGNRLSAYSAADMRSKTDNLDRLINEVDRSSVDSENGGGREVKRYIRRRYTDSRHPTTELPDVRGDTSLPSVRDPPLRKSKSKQTLQEGEAGTRGSGELTAGSGDVTDRPGDGPDRPGVVTDRPSSKRWQKTASRNLEPDT